MNTPEDIELENSERDEPSNLAGVPPRNYEDLPKHVPIDWLEKES